MSDARRVAVIGVRAITGLVAIAVGIVVVIAVGVTPTRVSDRVASLTVTPQATALQAVCPGALMAVNDSGVISAVGQVTVRSGAIGTEAHESTVSGATSRPSVLTAEPTSGALLGGAQSQSVATSALLGYAAAACRAPTGDSWLVGGATTTGRTTLVSLTNPTAIDATVELRIWSEAGLVSAPGLKGIDVPAGAQRILSLAGFAPNAASPVVEVLTSGGEVAASLEQSTTRVLDPGGVDLVTPAATPSKTAVVPGVVFLDEADTDALRGRDDYSDLQPVLRLLEPGNGSSSASSASGATAGTTARVSVVPDAGSGAGGGTTFTVPLTAGTVTDVPLDTTKLGNGSYTVTVNADAPVIAAVRASTAQPLASAAPDVPPLSDFAWFVAAPALTARAVVTVPTGASPTLHMANEGTSAVAVTVAGPSGSGAPTTVTVAPLTSVAVPLSVGVSYSITGGTGLHAALSLGAEGALAGFPITSPPPDISSIVVRTQ